MKLSRVERWTLANQYRILEALYPKEAKDHCEAREAIERGYELHYGEIAEFVYDDQESMTESECREVLDTLSMFDALKRGMASATPRPNVESWRVEFAGFDGNNESKQLAYAKYFCQMGGGGFRVSQWSTATVRPWIDINASLEPGSRARTKAIFRRKTSSGSLRQRRQPGNRAVPLDPRLAPVVHPANGPMGSHTPYEFRRDGVSWSPPGAGRSGGSCPSQPEWTRHRGGLGGAFAFATSPGCLRPAPPGRHSLAPGCGWGAGGSLDQSAPCALREARFFTA